MNNSKIKLLILCVSALSILFAAGLMLSCSDNPIGSEPSGSQLALNFSIASSPELMAMVDSFQVVISGNNFEPFKRPLIFENGWVKGTIDSVPIGDAIIITIQALDDRVIYEGVDTIPVLPDVVNEAIIQLVPVVSMVKLSPRYLTVGVGQTSSFALKVYGIHNLSQLSFRLHWDIDVSIDFSTVVNGTISNRLLVYDTLGGATTPPYFYACALLNTDYANRIVDANGYATLGTVSFISPTPEILPDTMIITIDSLTMYDTARDSIATNTVYGDQTIVVIDSETPGLQTDTVTDINWNVYQTVKIGDQWWMAENLKATHYRNGDSIPQVTDNGLWSDRVTGACCDYDNESAYADTYGKLYNWYAVDYAGSIAPEGWHVPSNTEWQTLIDHLGGDDVAGGKLKESGFTHWSSPNTGATNESGFTGLPGGYRDNVSGIFDDIGNAGRFWTSSPLSATEAADRVLTSARQDVTGSFTQKKEMGFSIRCVKDN